MVRAAIIENAMGLGDFFLPYLGEAKIFSIWNGSDFPVEDYDLYVIAGDYKNLSSGILPHHRRLMNFVKTILDRPIYGSCFGHQVLSLMLGGEVVNREHRFFGWQSIDIVEEHPIFEGVEKPHFLGLNVDEVGKIPDGAKLLATAPACKHQVLQVGDNIITCQTHPEILKDDALRVIEKNRLSLSVQCPDLDGIVESTIGKADDQVNKRFLNNVFEWLLHG